MKRKTIIIKCASIRAKMIENLEALGYTVIVIHF